jgi:hypothetical protein
MQSLLTKPLNFDRIKLDNLASDGIDLLTTTFCEFEAAQDMQQGCIDLCSFWHQYWPHLRHVMASSFHQTWSIENWGQVKHT